MVDGRQKQEINSPGNARTDRREMQRSLAFSFIDFHGWSHMHARLKRKNGNYIADPLAAFKALNKATLFEHQAKLDLSLPVRLSFENILRTTYNHDDIYLVYSVARICLSILKPSDVDVYELCQTAKQEIVRLHQNLKVDGACAPVSDTAKASIASTLDVFENLLHLMSPNQMVQTIGRIQDDIKHEVDLS